MILMPENKKYFVKTNVIFFWHRNPFGTMPKEKSSFFRRQKCRKRQKFYYLYISIYYIFCHFWHHVLRTIMMFSFCPDIHIIWGPKVPKGFSGWRHEFFPLARSSRIAYIRNRSVAALTVFARQKEKAEYESQKTSYKKTCRKKTH